MDYRNEIIRMVQAVCPESALKKSINSCEWFTTAYAGLKGTGHERPARGNH